MNNNKPTYRASVTVGLSGCAYFISVVTPGVESTEIVAHGSTGTESSAWEMVNAYVSRKGGSLVR